MSPDFALPQFRPADASDADAVAALHADSWRRHYRGAYSDAYLDGDVISDRAVVWNDRLRHADDDHVTVAAEENGVLVGFVHTIFGEHPTWGALLDNLHVAHSHQRRGIGARLVELSAEAVADRAPSSGLHLWVLEQNLNAQAFYAALGGRPVERAKTDAPGGDPARLHGSPMKLRYTWPAPLVIRRVR